MRAAVVAVAVALGIALAVAHRMPQTVASPMDDGTTAYLPGVRKGKASPTDEAPTPVPTPTGLDWEYLTYADGVSQIAHDEARDTLWAVGWGGVAAWDRTAETSTVYTLAEGLPSHQVSCVALAPDGTPWIGTRGAGAAWLGADGRWHAARVADGLLDDDVLSVAADREGGIWFGSVRGATRRNPDGRWTTFTPENGEVGSTVTAIAFDSRGNGWFGTYASGLSMRRADGTWAEDGPESAGDGPRFVLALDVDPDERLWMLTGTYETTEPEGVRFQPRVDVRAPDGSWSAFDVTGWLADGALRSVAFDAAGRPWFAGDEGLFRPAADGGWTRLGEAEGLPADGLLDVAFDVAGRAWVGSMAGIGREAAEGAWDLLRLGGLPSRTVNDIAFSPDGTAWLASAGLASLDPEGRWRTRTTEDGLYRDAVFAVATDEAGGVWFSSGSFSEDEDRGGVHYLAPDGSLQGYTVSDGLCSAQVTGIALDSLGNAFFACDTYFYAPGQRRDGGLGVRHADGTWETLRRGEGPPTGGDPSALAVDRGNALWVGSEVISGAPQDNLSRRLPDGTWEVVSVPDGARAFGVHDLLFDATGQLWMSAGGGVYRRGANGRWVTPDDDPAMGFTAPAIAQTPDGAMWFGSFPGVRLLQPDGNWVHIGLADGLPEAMVEEIQVAPDGRVWFTGRTGNVSILRRE